jgi:glutathione S-transferase
MIKLYQFSRSCGVPNPSPFCMKLECFLRMNQLEYEIVEVGDPRKGPKGKCPWIVDDEGVTSDSELIMDHLQERYSFDPDAGLTEQQRALSRTIQGMLDERYYWVIVYNRWIDERNWPQLQDIFFGKLPGPLRKIISTVARTNVRRQLVGQGMGRHSAEEVYGIGRADIDTLSILLGDKLFIHGDEPTRIDACVISYVANTLIPSFENPLKAEMESRDNLKAYCSRLLEKYFP